MTTEAIVNAANEQLFHGGDVAGAIVRKGGARIQQESDEWVRRHGRVPTGQAAITSGGNLRARYVIHAVGPVYDGTARSAELLASAVKSALQLADQYNLKSIALPAISTGIFGYPMAEAARVILKSIRAYLQGPTNLAQVILCLYDQTAYATFREAWQEVIPQAPDDGR